MPKQNLTLDLKQRLRGDLPGIVDGVLELYQQFITDTGFDDAKQFSAHFAARKAAMAHMEQLIKLCQWADGHVATVEESDDPSRIEALLQQARADLAKSHPAEN